MAVTSILNTNLYTYNHVWLHE